LGQLLRRLDVLVAVSEDTRDDHLRYLPSLRKGPCRLETIHNGIPIDQFSDSNGHPAANLRQRLGIGADIFLMGFLGRFMKQKGFLVLIEALSILCRQDNVQPFHVVAVGSSDLLVNYQRELAKNPEVEQCISFMDHVPHSAPILRELDLLVMPSLWEAHPLLPMEAMVIGVPIIGTNCLGLREVLEGSPSRVVPPAAPERLALALREAITNPWRDDARKYIPIAKERFDVDRTAGKLLELFKELCH